MVVRSMIGIWVDKEGSAAIDTFRLSAICIILNFLGLHFFGGKTYNL